LHKPFREARRLAGVLAVICNINRRSANAIHSRENAEFSCEQLRLQLFRNIAWPIDRTRAHLSPYFTQSCRVVVSKLLFAGVLLHCVRQLKAGQAKGIS
jgi:hypothetical protein